MDNNNKFFPFTIPQDIAVSTGKDLFIKEDRFFLLDEDGGLLFVVRELGKDPLNFLAISLKKISEEEYTALLKCKNIEDVKKIFENYECRETLFGHCKWQVTEEKGNPVYDKDIGKVDFLGIKFTEIFDIATKQRTGNQTSIYLEIKSKLEEYKRQKLNSLSFEKEKNKYNDSKEKNCLCSCCCNSKEDVDNAYESLLLN